MRQPRLRNLLYWTGIFLMLAALTIAANLYFVLTAAQGVDAHPKLTERANTHFVVYGMPMAGYRITGSILRDYCYAEQRDAPRPRLHASFLVYGWLYDLLDDPFSAHLAGNIILVALTLVAGLILARVESVSLPAGLLVAGLLFFNIEPHNLYKLARLAGGALSSLVGVGTGGASVLGGLIMSVNLVISRTLAMFAGLAGIYLFIAHARNPRRASLIALATLVGLSAYVQIHLFLTLLLTIGVAMSLLAWHRRLPWWHVLAFMGIGALLAIPQQVYIAGFEQGGSLYDVFVLAYGVFYGKEILFPPVIPVLIMGAVAALLFFSRRSSALKFLGVGFIVSVFVLTNIHLVLGKNPVPTHWWHMAYTFLIPLGLLALPDFCRSARQRRSVVALVFCIVLGLLALQGLSVAAAAGSDSYFDEDLRDSLLWMKRQLPPEAVVLAPPELSPYIVMYSLRRTYACPFYQTTVPFEENALRMLQNFWAYGRPIDVDDPALQKHLSIRILPANWKQFLTMGVYPYSSEIYRARLVQPYRAGAQTLIDQGIERGLSRQADYALVSGNDQLHACIQTERVHRAGSYEVHRIVDHDACA